MPYARLFCVYDYRIGKSENKSENYVEPGASPENDPRSKYEGVD